MLLAGLVSRVLLNFLSLIADMGLGISIIQHPETTKEEQNALFSFSFFLGIGVSIVMIIASFPVSAINDKKFSNTSNIEITPYASGRISLASTIVSPSCTNMVPYFDIKLYIVAFFKLISIFLLLLDFLSNLLLSYSISITFLQ